MRPVTPASLGDRKPSWKKGRLERVRGVQMVWFTQTIPCGAGPQRNSCLDLKVWRSPGDLGKTSRKLQWKQREMDWFPGSP